jgi:hypothetical protein
VSGYNYETFDGYVASGAPAPDIAGTLLDDDQLTLSSVWKHRTVVVEFGSFT